jgi:hypothetical protein
LRIVAPPGAPPWAAAFVEQINRAIAVLAGKPQAPVMVYAVDNATALGNLPPKDNLERMIYVRDIARLAVSNGVNWLRMDNGATL